MNGSDPTPWFVRRRPVWPVVAGFITGSIVGGLLFWVAGPHPVLIAVVVATGALALVRWSMITVRVDARGVFVRNWFRSRTLRWDEIAHFDHSWRASLALRPLGVARVVAWDTDGRRVPLRATTTVQAWASASAAQRDTGAEVARFQAMHHRASVLDLNQRMASARPDRCWSCDAPLHPGSGFCPHCGRNVPAASAPVGREHERS